MVGLVNVQMHITFKKMSFYYRKKLKGTFLEEVLMSGEYLTSTLRAPRGVTRVAGAKAYAAKLAASPAPTVKTNNVGKHNTKQWDLQHRQMSIKIL